MPCDLELAVRGCSQRPASLFSSRSMNSRGSRPRSSRGSSGTCSLAALPRRPGRAAPRAQPGALRSSPRLREQLRVPPFVLLLPFPHASAWPAAAPVGRPRDRRRVEHEARMRRGIRWVARVGPGEPEHDMEQLLDHTERGLRLDWPRSCTARFPWRRIRSIFVRIRPSTALERRLEQHRREVVLVGEPASGIGVVEPVDCQLKARRA